MQQNATTIRWTQKHERAVELVVDGRKSDEEIAFELGIHRATLHRWKERPDFARRVDELRQKFRTEIEERGILERRNRLAALDDRWQRMKALIDARAADPQLQDVPGGATGLLVRSLRGLGRGDEFQIVEDVALDAALLKELREHEKQAAQELGQWTEKRELTGKDGGPVVVAGIPDLTKLSAEELELLERLLARATPDPA